MSEAVVVKCSHCGQKLKAPVTRLGKTVKCPKCQQDFVLQAATNAATPAATPAPTVVTQPDLPRIATAKPLASAPAVPVATVAPTTAPATNAFDFVAQPTATVNPLPDVNLASIPITSNNPFDFLAKSAAAPSSMNAPVVATPVTASVVVANPVPALATDAGLWSLCISNGTVYGPVPRAELDRWYAEGRIDDSCAVQQAGDANWLIPSTLFAASTAPTANAGSPILATIAQSVVDNNPYSFGGATNNSVHSRYGAYSAATAPITGVNWSKYQMVLMITMGCFAILALLHALCGYQQWSIYSSTQKFLDLVDAAGEDEKKFDTAMKIVPKLENLQSNLIVVLGIFAVMFVIQVIVWAIKRSFLTKCPAKDRLIGAILANVGAMCLAIVFLMIEGQNKAKASAGREAFENTGIPVVLILAMLSLWVSYLIWVMAQHSISKSFQSKKLDVLAWCTMGAIGIRLILICASAIPGRTGETVKVFSDLWAFVCMALMAVVAFALHSIITRGIKQAALASR
jgi:hypothetical protein